MKTKAILVCLAALCLGACNTGSDQKEIQAATSPDGLVKARIVEEGFGATVPDVSSIQLLFKDRDPDEILRADRVQGLTLRWRDARTLDIEMACGRIFRFSNVATFIDKDGKKFYRVSIGLKTALPCPADR